MNTTTTTTTSSNWRFEDDAYPMSATFPIGGGTCFLRFCINWHLTEKGCVEIVSLEPQFGHEVHEVVWTAFLIWAEAQKPEWTRWLDGIVEDLRTAQHDNVLHAGW